MSFRVEVYALVRRIPPGQVMTYGQIAAHVGRARAARAVGGAMRHCPDGVPWHRVVNGQGGISRRRQDSGMLTQRIRLEQEGVHLRRGRVWLARYQWEPPLDGARRVLRRGSIGGRSGPASRIAAIVGSPKQSSHPAPSVGRSKRPSHPAPTAGRSKRSPPRTRRGESETVVTPRASGGQTGGPGRPPGP
jgi:methylated-DNA-protein-cysteine methyltransferase related protein